MTEAQRQALKYHGPVVTPGFSRLSACIHNLDAAGAFYREAQVTALLRMPAEEAWPVVKRLLRAQR